MTETALNTGDPQHPAMPAGPAPAARPVTLSWAGDPWSLVGLGFINLGLTIVTLGIYSFWGRTEVRKRVWSSVRIDGEPLAYTGTGGEMFKGFLIVAGAVLLPVLVLQLAALFAFGPNSVAPQLISVITYVAFFYLIGVAAWRARRYRLSRTNWRGIRGTMEGSSWRYGNKSFFSTFLYPLTAGWSAPWRANMLQRELVNDTRLGSRPLKYVGTTQGLYGRFAALWFGSLGLYLLLVGGFAGMAYLKSKGLTPGTRTSQPSPYEIAAFIGLFLLVTFLWSIISGWYRSRLYNHFAASTSFEGARFKLDTTAGGLIWLFVSNYLMTALSFGVLRPVAEARAMRYYVERFQVTGPIDLDAVSQSQAALDRTGEGLATVFDVDIV